MPRSKNFPAVLDPACLSSLNEYDKIGVAVSGGADSMALAHLLRAAFPKKTIYAYTVDHALRTESADEAKQVSDWLSSIATHRTLVWHNDKPETAIQEEARGARYDLLHQACTEDGVGVLCLGHHQDDQGETLLHRLAKGSGLDGLGGMRTTTPYQDIVLMRPLLNASHDDLVRYCKDNSIDWIEDPSNENEKFARVRLRHARQTLEGEGLTNTRLSRLADRMQRASDALDFYARQEWAVWKLEESNDKIILAPDVFTLPDEIGLRIILIAADKFAQGDALRGNLKRLEDFYLERSRARTRISLARLLITLDPQKGLIIERE